MGRARAAAALAGATALAALAYGLLVEPRTVTLTRVVIREGGVAAALAGRRAALLGDLHFGARGEPAATKALALLERERPDLILLVGDYVKWGAGPEAYERALEFLARLHAPLGVFAVLGDADRTFSRKSCEFCHEPGTGDPTRRHRVTFLSDSRREVLRVGDAAVSLVHLDAEDAGAHAAAAPLPDGLPAIVLAHSSVVFARLAPGQDVLVLSGDTHGGQVRLPRWLWRAVRYKPDPDHLYGYHREGRASLFVTRGLGTSRPPLRLGVRPEVVLLEFRAAEAARDAR